MIHQFKKFKSKKHKENETKEYHSKIAQNHWQREILKHSQNQEKIHTEKQKQG